MGQYAAGANTLDDLDLSELREFGVEANRLEFPCIADGGFVVSGRRAAAFRFPEKEESSHGRRKQTGEEAGSSARTRQRSSAEAPAARAPAHAVRRDFELDRQLDELADYGAPITVVRRSARFAYVRLPVGLFSTLPFTAELLLEIPMISRSALRAGLPARGGLVPDIRVWSRWSEGSHGLHGLISSHHIYPDQSMCVCMEHEWHLDRDPLIRYVDYSILWIARELHDHLLGSYPGRQHYGEKIRVERDRGDEFCGCGKPLPYSVCHRQSDIAMPWIERMQRHHVAQRAYLGELSWQERSVEVPSFVSSRHISKS